MSKVITGARAQLSISGPNGAGVVGIFNNVSWGMSYGAEPIFILGRYSPDEIVYTSQEAVSVSASGWRVIDNGAHVAAQMPSLDEIMTSPYLELIITDRQTGKKIAHIHSVRPTSYNTSLANRQPEEISISFMGLLVDDESTINQELGSATKLP